MDEGLAEWARERLPAPPDTLEAIGVAQPRPLAPPSSGTRGPRRRRSRLLTWVGLLAVLCGTAFLVGSRAGEETPTAVPPGAVAGVPTSSVPTLGPAAEPPARTRPPRGSTGAAAAGPRRLAWAPVAGATGYHVELFAGPTLIFRADTAKPQILVRTSWRFDGRRRTLRPGAYRWYVWPRVAGRRTAKAIVQARLVVSR